MNLHDLVARGDVEGLRKVLAKGTAVDAVDERGRTALLMAMESPLAGDEVVELLIAAGAELSEVNAEMRACLTGVAMSHSFDVSSRDFRLHRSRRYGKTNPERMNNSFWDAMVRARCSAYTATAKFGDSSIGKEPAWSFSRFGQSFTRLPDGKYVEIGGEHEDYYDPDFCIYNDVVVHHGNGKFDIFGYPEQDFPPTDFHSATYLAPYIYIIGCLGYAHQRRHGETPVFRLHCGTWKMETIPSSGESPGWIHGHSARTVSDRQIEIRGGKIETSSGKELADNNDSFVYDLTTGNWRRKPNEPHDP